jgi:hypothetical protein
MRLKNAGKDLVCRAFSAPHTAKYFLPLPHTDMKHLKKTLSGVLFRTHGKAMYSPYVFPRRPTNLKVCRALSFMRMTNYFLLP